MPAWLDEIVAEDKLLLPGHSACAGCGPAINVRHVLGGLAAARPGSKIVLVIPASCWTIIAGVFPANAFGVSVHLTPFASAAAEASGIKAALRLRGLGDTTVVVWGGDGSTSDIGFSGLSAAADRNEDHHLRAERQRGVHEHGRAEVGRDAGGRVDDDDTGRRRRGSGRRRTSPGSWRRTGSRTSRRSRSAPCRCCATSGPRSRGRPRSKGFRFRHVLGGCPPGWRYPTGRSTEVARLAVESRYFPLFECDHGEWKDHVSRRSRRCRSASSSRRRDASAT